MYSLHMPDNLNIAFQMINSSNNDSLLMCNNNYDGSSDSSYDENNPSNLYRVFGEFFAADSVQFIIFWRDFLEKNADSNGMFHSEILNQNPIEKTNDHELRVL